MEQRPRRTPRTGGRLRRALAMVPCAVLLLGFLAALPPDAHTTGVAQAATGTTVPGPRIWDPATQTKGEPGSVTVSQTANLTDQVVHVSWKGFTPTTNDPVVILPNNNSAAYPVRVYQCRGTDPKITDCYGSSLYNADAAKGFDQEWPGAGSTTPEFPTNAQVSFTHADGTGSVDIEVWTSEQSQTLGCDPHHACSIVVEANYGGDAWDVNAAGSAAKCDDHTYDTDYGALDSVNFGQDFQTGFADGESCAWANRVKIPLTFAPTPTDCKETAADFSIQGLEMANRALQQWRSGFCGDASPISVQYTPSGGEPQARAQFRQTLGSDVALTALPDTEGATRPYVYSPLANTGISVVFVVDDDKTGAQILHMRLNARLMAKLLTQSYVGDQGVRPGDAAFASVDGNPACLFDDPEFVQLNPGDPQNGPNWPVCNQYSLPIVVGGTTDLVQQLTSWIAADPKAEQFLQGMPDPWGMHLDTFYLRPGYAGYPTDSFVPQDASGKFDNGGAGVSYRKQLEWNPLLGGLGQVARHVLSAQPSCNTVSFDAVTHARTDGHCAALLPGQRSVLGILDAGQARAYSLPEAELQNPAGAFVAPTADGLQAAVGDMPVDASTGTQALPYGKPGTDFAKDKDAYPLTTVQYAMLPTKGLTEKKADKISQFVSRATDPGRGQIYGFQPGRLAPGFLDLTPTQQKQAQAAVKHVQGQDGAYPGNQSGPSGSDGPVDGGSGGGAAAGGTSGGSASGDLGGGSAGGAASGGAGGAAAGGATASGGAGTRTARNGGPLDAQPAASGSLDPDRAGGARFVLPALLIAGGVLLLGAPAALVLTGTPAGETARRRMRDATAAARRGLGRLRPGR
ncbi:hypothetical protein [Streptomyces sp. NPDC049040]|uniref:hypothetical protein n=1 Tax=Streptomyces sp. NPDC049040 TaxID=3365593 RepID=UPI003719FD41